MVQEFNWADSEERENECLPPASCTIMLLNPSSLVDTGPGLFSVPPSTSVTLVMPNFPHLSD